MTRQAHVKARCVLYTCAVSACIRPARADEAHAISDIHALSVRALCAPHYTPAQLRLWLAHSTPGRHARKMEDPERDYLVWDEDGVVLGFAVLHGSLLSKLYVHPDAGGRGIGRALLGAMEDLARSRGVRRAHLVATLNGEPFYAAHGYEAIRRSSVGPSGAPVVVMEKTLTSASSGRPSEASG